jgi:hypothetical protein
LRLPDASQRLSIVGATGTGKTVAAVWHLSMRDYLHRPWIVYNWKGDKNIDGIPGKIDIGVDEIPIRPGVYVVHPHPSQQEEVEQQMWSIWDKQGIGVYVDEGYMVGKNNPAFRSLLTQGRSREIPIITLSQRPVWMDRFVFTESEFFQVFRLQHKDDRTTVEKFVPADLSKRLPQHHSYYYDVNADTLTPLKPVPPIEEIYPTFASRLRRVKKVF